jgi:hypothetical protein
MERSAADAEHPGCLCDISATGNQRTMKLVARSLL